MINHYAGGIWCSCLIIWKAAASLSNPKTPLSESSNPPPLVHSYSNVKRITKPPYKALHCDTSCWPQLHLRCVAVVFDSGIESHCDPKVQDTYLFCDTTVSLCMPLKKVLSNSPPFLSLTPKALLWTMHSHSICWDPESTHRTKGITCFLCQSHK